MKRLLKTSNEMKMRATSRKGNSLCKAEMKGNRGNQKRTDRIFGTGGENRKRVSSASAPGPPPGPVVS